MTLEERIVDELQAEARAVPGASPGPTPVPQAAWVKRLGIAATLMALLVGGWAATRLASGGASRTVAVAGMNLPVESLSPIGMIGDNPMYRGSVGKEELHFEPNGTEMPLRQVPIPQSPSNTALMIEPGSPLIYIGEVGRGSAYLYPASTKNIDIVGEQPETGLAERILSWLLGESAQPQGVCRHIAEPQGSGAATCDIAAGEELMVLTQAFDPLVPEADLNLWWTGLPGATAIVTLTSGEEALWQRPSALTAVFEADQVPEGAVLRALDKNGRILAEMSAPR